ncbi:MAG TPA: hypothetical protein VHL11_02395, partial [Phototrophicaceae bacterium]|nr:hypothetical protein [Phototrophicaceae bacterium]
MADEPKFTSLRLQQLSQALQDGDSVTVMAAFWDEIKTRGTPLIEPLPDDDPDTAAGKHILVTFLFEGNSDTENVYLHSPLAPPPAKGSLAGKLLTRFGDPQTGDSANHLWYHTEKLREDLRTTYQLLPNDPRKKSAEMTEEENKALRTKLYTAFDPLNARKMIFPGDPDVPDDPDFILSIFEAPKVVPQKH